MSQDTVMPVGTYIEFPEKVVGLNKGAVGFIANTKNCDLALFASIEDAKNMHSDNSISIDLDDKDSRNAKANIGSYFYVYGDVDKNKKTGQLQILGATLGAAISPKIPALDIFCNNALIDKKYQNLRVIELISDPEAFDNKMVSAFGFFGKFNNGYAVYTDVYSSIFGIKSQAISINQESLLISGGLSAKALLGKYVLVKGRSSIPKIRGHSASHSSYVKMPGTTNMVLKEIEIISLNE